MAQKQIIIFQNEPAPFNGVLIPEDIYRKIQADVQLKNDFNSELQKCLNSKAQQSDDSFSHTIGLISVGAIVGIVVGVVLSK